MCVCGAVVFTGPVWEASDVCCAVLYPQGLCELAQGQEALERAYLAARDEHKFLQQGGSRLPPFDPNR